MNLDGNDDGDIDADDDTNGDDVIDADDAGTALPTLFVDLDKIVAVKIWLLAKTGHRDRNYTSANTYVVGNRIMDKNDDGNRRNLVTTTVKCRNMAL